MTFEPGVDVVAKVTIFCDGVRGNLTKDLLRRLQLGAGRQPQQFAIGLKELWEVPAGRLAPGTVMHTMGYPLRFEEFGGWAEVTTEFFDPENGSSAEIERDLGVTTG